MVGCTRLGTARPDPARRRQLLVPRSEHLARHDRPQPRADGRAGGGHRVRRAVRRNPAEARMWDDAQRAERRGRVLLALRRDRVLLRGARRAGSCGSRSSRSARSSSRRRSRARIRAHVEAVDPRRARAERCSRWTSRASRAALARVPWVRARGAAPPGAGRGSRSRSRSTCRSRAGTTPASSTRGRSVRRRLRRRAAAVRRTRRAARRTWRRAIASGATRSRRSRSPCSTSALSARGGWHLRVAGGGGAARRSSSAATSLPGALARFVAAYRATVGALARAGTRVERVDLRYRNGFAARVPGFPELPAKKA